MKRNIEKAIAGFDCETQRRILETATALDNGKAQSIEIYSDGSGACFTYWHPTINHGLPGTVARSFDIQQALIILAGHRLCSHEFPKCF